MLLSSLEFAKGALQQISIDCSATLVQFTHDIEFDRIQVLDLYRSRDCFHILTYRNQISNLQTCLMEKEKELQRMVAAVEQRSDAREREFENQVQFPRRCFYLYCSTFYHVISIDSLFCIWCCILMNNTPSFPPTSHQMCSYGNGLRQQLKSLTHTLREAEERQGQLQRMLADVRHGLFCQVTFPLLKLIFRLILRCVCIRAKLMPRFFPKRV